MGSYVNYSGLVIAGVGFFLTRFTVSLAIYEDPVRFYLVGVVPLALGLGLAAFGVALTVADVEASLVRTTALWCVVGAGTMLVLVALTLLGATAGGATDAPPLRSQTYLANFLIGGSVGGTLTGLYAARTRRQRGAVRRQANRLVVLNRLLRHEVLNDVAVIHGYASTRDGESARDVILERANAIQETIEEVKHLTRRAERGATVAVPVDLEERLSAAAETVADRHPEARISVGDVPEVTVRANERLEAVFAHLLENAVVHGGDDAPRVEVTPTRGTVRVSVIDEGPGLPERQRALLESGDVEEFDDPRSGFGLKVVRLLVESYGGEIEPAVSEAGTTITVVLPRVTAEKGGPSRSDLSGVRPAIPHLVVTLAAAVVAGVVYGAVSEALGGSIAGIGVFYGTANATVGWITHEFHSIVFGFAFLGLLSLVPERRAGDLATYVGVGVGWGVVLWMVAAGVIAPIWLQLLGISAEVPSFSLRLLANHLAWGLSLGLLTAGGYRYVAPRLARRWR